MDPRIVHRKRVVVARAERDGPRVARELEAARALLARERRESEDVLDVVAERLAEDLARLEPKASALSRFLSRRRARAEAATPR